MILSCDDLRRAELVAEPCCLPCHESEQGGMSVVKPGPRRVRRSVYHWNPKSSFASLCCTVKADLFKEMGFSRDAFCDVIKEVRAVRRAK